MLNDHTLRRMYPLLHANMQQMIPLPGAYEDICHEWMSAWRGRIRQEDIRHILDQDGERLRGFMVYSVNVPAGTIHIDELQIDAGSQKNGVTLRRLLANFLDEIESIPCNTVLTYANKQNPFSPGLALNMGFVVYEETERGRYRTGKAELLERLRHIRSCANRD